MSNLQRSKFKQNDLVVLIPSEKKHQNHYEAIFTVIGKPIQLIHLKSPDGKFLGRFEFEIRHATPEEIKAGRRLF